MANPRAGDQDGVAAQYGQDYYHEPDVRPHQNPQHRQQHNNQRPFTLNEALPYTPFTTVFPFEPGIINNPTIGSGQLAPPVADLVSHEDYEALNREATSPNQSKRLEGSLEYVQNLLKPEKITQYEFKSGPKRYMSREGPVRSLADGLSPFTKMLYENTAISFRYPTPEAPKGENPNGQAMASRAPKKSSKPRKSDPLKVVKHNPAVANAQAIAKNHSHIEVHLPSQKDLSATAGSYASPKPDIQPQPVVQSPMLQPQTVAPSDLMVVRPQQLPPVPYQSQPSQSKAYVAPEEVLQTSHQLPQTVDHVALEASPSAGSHVSQPFSVSVELPAANPNKAEFAIVDDSADVPHYLSQKRSRAELDENEDVLDSGLNNRERANAALKELQRFLQEVFEAEDSIARQEGRMSPWVIVTAGQDATMTISAHTKVQKLLLRTLDLGCFRLAPLEDLLRVQGLCDGALKHAENVDYKIDDSWGEFEVNMWIQQLQDIEMGLKAARTALIVMSSGREEKQLYSEDLIRRSLDLFQSITDKIIIPIVELRNGNELFRHLSAQKKPLNTIFMACQKLFALMSTLTASIDLSDTVINTLEFTSSRLIFVENAHTERDSVVGVQKFDGLRLVAMDTLSQIFLTNPAQRQGILTDILTSLEKLPKGKLSARQFKLTEGGSIQPISALIMRLVQASAGIVKDRRAQSHNIIQSLENDGRQDQGTLSNGVKPIYSVKTEDSAAIQSSTAIQELETLTSALADDVKRNASYVINFIVKRAQKSTKTGDTPYRNLLDLFVEDFTLCLGSPDWPAAELLLRLMMFMMLELINGEKTAAPAKNMALEILGVMAAAISKLRSAVRKTASSFEGSDSDELGFWLADLTSTVLSHESSAEKITSWLGPYRVVLESLEDRVQEDPHLGSAISYMVTDWAIALCAAYDDENQEDDSERDAEYGRTAYRLRNMVEDRRWLTSEYSFKSVTSNHAKLSYSTILLRSQFCDFFQGILNILLQSMTTDAATVRSRSLKSINQVLETDPSILDGDSAVIGLILQCSSDPSPQVRDSALGLVGKCIGMRPSLEEQMIPTVIQRFIDSGVGVRKRAMKLARDIYLGNRNRSVRAAVANALLHRMQDPDEGVRELARQMIEEVWLSPFYKADDSTASKQSMADHVALIAQTIKQGNSSAILEKVLEALLSHESKIAVFNREVCTRLVANMFDMVDNPESDDASTPSGKDALQVLMIFAKAEPRLFTFEQIRLLQPRIASVGSNEDLPTSKAVVAIYRRVLPQVSSVHSEFLADVRRRLMPTVSNVTRALLDDVIACLWIISGLLDNSLHLATLVCSSLVALQKIKQVANTGPLDHQTIRKFDRYSLIVGMAGKHCNLDKNAEIFRKRGSFPKWKGDSVSKLMVDVLIYFASPLQPLDVRRPALDAVGLVCQSNPRNFVAANVYTTFQQVFDEQNRVLESMVLRSFKEFLFTEERRSEQAAAAAKDNKETVKRDLKVMGGTSFDDVASATTQRFLKEITRIALATQDEHAVLAAEVLGTINRQGLVHPKETVMTFITLETCSITKISELAYHEHRALHEKHETTIEREYVKAIQSAFHYQRDVAKDPHGATTDPFTSKLHLLMEVVKISKGKNRLRFLEKFVGQVDFDPAKLEVDGPFPQHVEFSRFILENLAFFEYVTVVDLQATVNALEKLVTNTGQSIAQSIESDVFEVRVETVLGSQQPLDQQLIEQQLVDQQLADGEPQRLVLPESHVDPQRLRQLAAGSMILLVVWETRTFLRRLYGLKANRHENRGKAAGKDPAKAPVKVQGVAGEKFWDDVSAIMTGLDGPERMTETCKAFVELMNVDSELKVAEEEDELDLDEEARTPEQDNEDDNTPDPENRGRKRKAASTPGGRKKRARSNSKPPRPRGRPRKHPTEEEPDMDADADGEWV